MNDKDGIAKKIIADADENAAKVTEAAKASAEKNELAEKNQAAEYLSESRAAGLKAGENLIERRKTLGRLDGKKTVLKAKQELVSKVSAHALELLRGLKKDEYMEFVLSKVRMYCAEGDTVILDKNAPFSAAELESSGLFKEKKLKVKTGEDFGGGIILRNEKTDTDLSFNAVVAEAAEKFGEEISTRLLK